MLYLKIWSVDCFAGSFFLFRNASELVEQTFQQVELFHLVKNVDVGGMVLVLVVGKIGQDFFEDLQQVETLGPVKVPNVGQQRLLEPVLVDQFFE